MTPARDLFDELSPHVGHSGSCSEKEFIKQLNAAIRMLWRRGDWKGSEEFFAINPSGCEFVLPWEYETIRDGWRGKHPIPVRDQWYEAISYVGLRDCCECNCFGELVDTGKTTATSVTHPCGWRVEVEQGCRDTGDIRIVGRDPHNIRIEEALASGTTDLTFSTIEAIHKKPTLEPVRLNSVDPNTGERRFLATYAPSQVNPRMSVYKIIGRGCATLYCKAKKRFVPISSLDDCLLIDNVTALAFALQALNHLGKENQLYIENLNLAEESLNEDVEDLQAESFVPIDVEIAYKTENLSPGFGRGLRTFTHGDIN